MRLTVLGSSGGCPAPGNPASGYLIEHDGLSIWSDAGSGTFMSLMDHTDVGSLDAVVISHVHTDHCADLVALYGYLAYGPSGKMPIPVYLPEGALGPISGFVRAGLEHVLFQVFDFHVVGQGDTVQVGDVTVTFALTHHPVPTVASRFDASGRSLVYSADTGPGGGFPDLAARADVALVEATGVGSRARHTNEYHLTAGEAGAITRAASVDRLIVTHVSPTVDARVALAEAATAFGREPDLALPGLSVEI